MKNGILSIILGFLATAAAQAVIVADSQADFSSTQGYKNWYYGYYDTEFTASTFTAYDSYNTVWGDAWSKAGGGYDYGFMTASQAYPGRVGSDDKDPARRWVSTVACMIDISGVIQKEYGGGDPSWDNGALCRIYVDGVEKYALDVVPGTNNTLYPYSFSTMVNAGSTIDFVLNAYNNPGDDRTTFTAQIVPEPGMLALLAVGGLVVFKRRRA